MPSEDTQRLNPTVLAPGLNVMNILNEVIQEYPKAVSFASGRPAEDNFALDDWLAQAETFITWRAARLQTDERTVRNQLCQYGATNGIINELVARTLANDEGTSLAPAEVMITNGCQEAMSICLDGLFAVDDALAVTDPSYIGITGLAALRRIPVYPVQLDEEGPDLTSLAEAVTRARASGHNLRAFYVIPDFDNPSGLAMSLTRRADLLTYCAHEGMLVFEDNPYGMLRYEDERMPTLLAMDREGIVLHLGTFAKTVCPGLRVGYLASRAQAFSMPLVQLLSRVKSLTTVNTGQYVQAVIGGILLENNCSLRSLVEPALVLYRRRRDAMLDGLERHFGPMRAAGVSLSWNAPVGGFFITLCTPVRFALEEMRDCAARYGVICIPMSFFALMPESHVHTIRLSFSYVDEAHIESGLLALARYLRDRLEAGAAAKEGRLTAGYCAVPEG